MTILILIGFCLLLVAAVAMAPRDAIGRAPLLSAYNVVVGLFAIYIVMPAFLIYINSGSFTWARAYGGYSQLNRTMLLCAFALVVFVVGALVGRRTLSPINFRFSAHRPDPPLWVPIVLVVLGMMLKAYIVYSTGGIDAMVLRLSGYTRSTQSVDTLAASDIGLRTASGIADAGSLWLIVQAIANRTRIVLYSAVFILVFVTSYLMIGKRLVLILPLVAILCAVSTFRKPITVKYTPIALIAIVGIGMASLFTRTLLPASRANEVVDFDKISYAQGSAVKFYLYSLEFSSVEMVTVVRGARTAMLSMFGGGPLDAFVATNLTPILFTIPRVFWPGKPEKIYDVSYAVSSVLDGKAIEGAEVGYASTLIGTSYFFFGVIGVVIALFGFGWFTSAVDRRLVRPSWDPANVIAFAFMLTICFHFFRQGTIGWTFIVGILQQYGVLFGLLIIAWSSTWVRRTRQVDASAVLPRVEAK